MRHFSVSNQIKTIGHVYDHVHDHIHSFEQHFHDYRIVFEVVEKFLWWIGNEIYTKKTITQIVKETREIVFHTKVTTCYSVNVNSTTCQFSGFQYNMKFI